jgi:death on curing protein
MEFKLPDFETVLEIHNVILELYGGLAGVPHPGYIEMAIHRPQTYMSYDRHCDLHLVAALILDSIARYHAFADGNKRTALLTMLFVYNRNNVKLSYSLHVNRRFEKLVLDVAEKELPIKQIRLRLKRMVRDFAEIE